VKVNPTILLIHRIEVSCLGQLLRYSGDLYLLINDIEIRKNLRLMAYTYRKQVVCIIRYT